MSDRVRKVLIVEDEAIVAMDLAMMLEDAGFEVVGPYYRADRAVKCFDTVTPDAALLDINLGGDTSDEVAAKLEKLERPFAFISGYTTAGSPTLEKFPNAPCLSKPVEISNVLHWLHSQ